MQANQFEVYSMLQ